MSEQEQCTATACKRDTYRRGELKAVSDEIIDLHRRLRECKRERDEARERIKDLESQVEAMNSVVFDARRAERFEAACAALTGYRAADGECVMQANTVAAMARVDADALLARLAETVVDRKAKE